MHSLIRRAAPVLLTLLLPLPASSQESRLPGAIEAGLLLRQADGVKRVLLVAAHPDDEDTALLATLARGWGVEAAYFSFTRGEGGQNLIGTELGEGLGIIRTGELLAARAIDGAAQYFGRAFDFGYSKTAEETFDEWPRELVLSDLVWVIRVFRPHVVISMWGGTSRDGHGHHQAAGVLAREAYEAAGDPDRYPEQLAHAEPWRPLKLYRRTFFDPDAASLAIETGLLDPLLGRSHHQVAMASRSEHRSQGFGTAQTPGPRTTELALLHARVPSDASDPLLAGVDTTLVSLAAGLGPEAIAEIETYRRSIGSVRRQLTATDLARGLPALAAAQRALASLAARAASDGSPELRHELERRRGLIARATLALAAVRVQLRARDDVWVPGQAVLVEARVWSGRETEVTLGPPRIHAPRGWRIRSVGPGVEVEPDDTGPFGRFFRQEEPVAEPGAEVTLRPGELRVWRYRVTAPAGAEPTHPYFLERPRDGSVYRWPDDPGVRARPFRPPVLTASTDMALRSGAAELDVAVTVPVRYRGVTGSRGEFWRPIHVAPSVSVSPVTETLIWSASDLDPREIDLRVTSHDPEGATGAVELGLPTGWVASPDRRGFELDGEGSETTVSFSLAPEADTPAGEFFVRPRLETFAGSAPAVDASFIDYEHIEPRLLAPAATVRIMRFPVRVAERSVGYVMGSGDEGPQAIRQLGLRVEPIEPGDWRAEQLERFDTIVLGVRAYEVRDDLIASNQLLLEWVERGGTLVVQYNRYEFNGGDFAPYPITIGRPAPRVTDEAARITLRRPEALPLREPNRITAADFEGWVQERGLYFPTSWDDRYGALLAMSDPGEPDRLGSLLVAPYGEGAYVHTSLSFFRQLRAGVPGAFRLFANLISLDGRRLRAAR